MREPRTAASPDVGRREERYARERIGELPPSLGAVLRPLLPAVADEIVGVIREEVDAYHRPFGGSFGRAVRAGVELSLGEFVDLLETPGGRERGAEAIFELGRGEVRAGRALDALQAAYRSGARVAWRRFGDAAREHGADAATLIALGEAIFAYIERLAALSVAGWAQEQSLRAGATQRTRDALVRLALGDPPAAPDDLDAAARELDWTPPRALAAVVLRGADPGDLLRVDPQIVASVQDGMVVGLVPAPGVADRVTRALAERDGALGPTVAWPAAARSYRRARDVLALRIDGCLPGAGPGLLLAADHLPALIVHGTPAAADELAAAVLGPLEALAPGRRARQLATLRAWLDHHGHGPRMAAALQLHPQTVRYRVARLRELFLVDLDDAEERFALELALRRRGLRNASGPPGDDPAA